MGDALKKIALVNTLTKCISRWRAMKIRVISTHQNIKFKHILKELEAKKSAKEEKLLINQNLGANVRKIIAAENTNVLLNLKKELMEPMVKALKGQFTEEEFKESYSKAFISALAPNQKLLKQLESLRVGGTEQKSQNSLGYSLGTSFVKAFRADVSKAIGKPFGRGGRGRRRPGKTSSHRFSTYRTSPTKKN